MSRIDDLIKEFCRDGVQFESIGSVVQRVPTIRWGDVTGQEFQYIDLTSVDRVTHTINGTQTITGENAPSRAQQLVCEGDVIFGTTRPMLKRYAVIPAEYDRQVASTGYCVLRPQPDRLLSGFLFHLLGTRQFYAFVESNERGAAYPAIPDGVVKQFRIPVPPLEIQHEIVRVLGLFTELNAELEAERDARSTQYAYYRDTLLSSTGVDVRWEALGQLGSLFRGKRFTKRDMVPVGDGVACIHYGEIYTHFGTSADAVISNVRTDLAPSLRFAEPGDVVIVEVGETVEEVGKAVAWLGATPAAITDHSYVFRSELNPAYVSYFFQTPAFQRQKAKAVARTKVKTLLQDSLSRLTIPVPSHEDQERIVAALDKFDALVNDSSVGLPAEIAARRKQYEYYRDRLLTFEEASA